MKSNMFWSVLVTIVFFFAVGLGVVYVFPWQGINWGKMSLMQENLIVVSGTSREQKRNEIARFTAGASAINSNRDTAVNEVNGIITRITEVAKNFGIKDDDIKTSNMSIYQEEESYREDGVQKRRKGQWQVSNGVEIILRRVNGASRLADLLTKTGATNVYGPILTVDDTQKASDNLLSGAIEDAKKKAEIMAKASDRQLGEIVSVVEGSSPSSVYYREMSNLGGGERGGGGMPVEPGSSVVAKTVVVSFRLR